jgi:hypothetical protein
MRGRARVRAAVRITLAAVSEPLLRFVCPPRALLGTPTDWAPALLSEAELALLPGPGGLEEVDALAHALSLIAVKVLRRERDAAEQERTVMEFAARLPLVWVAPAFSSDARLWARERGPMTLQLQAADGPLPEQERRRIERFVAILAPQSE